jgi:integrase
VLHDTKNGERRSLAMNAPAREALAMLRRVRVLGSEFIFVGQYTPAGEAPTFTSSLRDSFALALREANVVNFRFHDLRHTAASYAAMSGATLPELAAFLGHKTIAMVQRYSHLSPGHMQAVADRMAAGFLADLTGAGA